MPIICGSDFIVTGYRIPDMQMTEEIEPGLGVDMHIVYVICIYVHLQETRNSAKKPSSQTMTISKGQNYL